MHLLFIVAVDQAGVVCVSHYSKWIHKIINYRSLYNKDHCVLLLLYWLQVIVVKDRAQN